MRETGATGTPLRSNEIPAAELPTALIVVNDLLAQGTLAALHRYGVLVPQEMSVCSFDTIDSSAFTIPPLKIGAGIPIPLRGWDESAAARRQHQVLV